MFGVRAPDCDWPDSELGEGANMAVSDVARPDDDWSDVGSIHVNISCGC
jgi:hypothetical protein